MATAQKAKKFDLSTLQKMKEPVRIRIVRKDRQTGGREQPIPLPLEEWSLADAARIEEIVLSDIAGGGSYEAQIIDQTGTSMQWEFTYPTEFFPPKIAPLSANYATPQPQAPQMPPINGQNGHHVAPQSGWQPGFYGTPVAMPEQAHIRGYQPPVMQQPGQFPGTPQYSNQGSYMPPPHYNPGFYGYPPPPPQSSSRSDRTDPRLEALQRELEKERAERQRTEYQRNLDQQQSQHNSELTNLKLGFESQMRELKEAIVDGRKPRGDEDPVFQLQKQQMELMRQQLADEKASREATERDTRHREEMRQLKESSDRQLDALKLMIEKSSEGRVDPTMQMMMELQRQQADAQKESARISADQARESSRLAAEQPRVVMELMERAAGASGSEKIVAQMAQAYQGSNEMYKGAVEMLLNMQGSPGWEMAGNAIEGGKEILEKFIQGKRDTAVAEQATQQMNAQAQAHTAAAYADAQMRAAQQAQQDPYRHEDGSIKGASPERVQLEGTELEDDDDVDSDVDETSEEGATKGGVTEAEIFGPIWNEVQTVRALVTEGEVTPAQVGQAIVQAAIQIQQVDVDVPVFALYDQRRYADLMDLVLPRTASDYLAQCVEAIIALRSQIESGIASPTVPEVGAVQPDLKPAKPRPAPKPAVPAS